VPLGHCCRDFLLLYLSHPLQFLFVGNLDALAWQSGSPKTLFFSLGSGASKGMVEVEALVGSFLWSFFCSSADPTVAPPFRRVCAFLCPKYALLGKGLT